MAAAVARRGLLAANRERRHPPPLAGLAAAAALHTVALLALVSPRPFEPAPLGEAPIIVEIVVGSPRRLLAPAPAASPSLPPPSASVARPAPALVPSVASIPAPPAIASPRLPAGPPKPAASRTPAVVPLAPTAQITAAAPSTPEPPGTVAPPAPAPAAAGPSTPPSVDSINAVPATTVLAKTEMVLAQAPGSAAVATASTALATVAATLGTSFASQAATLETARQPEEPPPRARDVELIGTAGRPSVGVLAAAAAAVAPERISAATTSTPPPAPTPDAPAVLPVGSTATLLRPPGPEPAASVATSVPVFGTWATIAAAPPLNPALTSTTRSRSPPEQAPAVAAVAGVAVEAPRSMPAEPAARPSVQTGMSPRPLVSPSPADVPEPVRRQPEALSAIAGPPPVSAAAAARVTPVGAGSATRPTDVAAAVPVAALPARALDVDALRERAAGALPCSRLEVGLREDLGVTVRGRVASPGDRGRLAAIVDAMLPAGTMADLDVEVVGAPFCAALDLVEAVAAGAVAAPPRPALNRADGVYREGDYVAVTVEIPGDADGHHLHVAFLDHAGKVVHLLPNPMASDTRVAAGQRVRLGVEAYERLAGVRDYRVTPPFGPGMILAILSVRPLPGVGAAEVEPLAAFLASLDSALESSLPGAIRLARVDLSTQP